MITWKLWSALQHPPLHHPVFQYILTMRSRGRHWRKSILAVLGLMLAYACYQLSFLQPPVRLVLFSLTLQDVLVIFISFNLVYGCILAAGISLTIARARVQGLYEALCLTPSGAPGVNWAMCTAVLYRRPGFIWFRLAILGVSCIPAVAVLIHIVMPLTAFGGLFLGRTTMSAEVMQAYYRMLLDLTYALTLVVAFYTGTVQSVILSVVLGMLTSASVRDSSARMIATGLFLLLQVFTFSLAAIFSLIILPACFQVLHLRGWLVDLGVPLLRLGFFFLLREAVNLLLWRTLVRQLNGELGFNVALLESGYNAFQ
ncbi:MAG: hypothetical protein K8I30_16205 [Anaerolineae bacterium]|nr:hypothetical protein [Anaerolineae bacterium]